ncbi:hypothetical protein BDV36DRAFT_244949 [Aspergillus pseudocaelatus]|uniref:BZIP domain-containing protein n=1 Tax=Aspergillus pseudocaelatus TaxID=1825620 RepID=A0ABQ6X3E8_9EURO|nr:hypothetical protein BDV36DRAFT_244949 [Aspergillus pseudocaelatus]
MAPGGENGSLISYCIAMRMSVDPNCAMITSVQVVGENWANIDDRVERRRAQNRIAQRGYRKSKLLDEAGDTLTPLTMPYRIEEGKAGKRQRSSSQRS